MAAPQSEVLLKIWTQAVAPHVRELEQIRQRYRADLAQLGEIKAKLAVPELSWRDCRRLENQRDELKDRLAEQDAAIATADSCLYEAQVRARTELKPRLLQANRAEVENRRPLIAALLESCERSKKLREVDDQIFGNRLPIQAANMQGTVPPMITYLQGVIEDRIPPLASGRLRMWLEQETTTQPVPAARDPNAVPCRMLMKPRDLDPSTVSKLGQRLQKAGPGDFAGATPGDIIPVPRDRVKVLVEAGMLEVWHPPAEPEPDRDCDPRGWQRWYDSHLSPDAWRARNSPEPAGAA